MIFPATLGCLPPLCHVDILKFNLKLKSQYHNFLTVACLGLPLCVCQNDGSFPPDVTVWSGWPRRGPSCTSSSMQLPTFCSCSSSAKGEPSAPTENTLWIIKTDNYCSLACAAWSPGRVMVIDFSIRDVLYRHCLYFSSVLLPPSSLTVCISAGCGRNAPAPHFPSPLFIHLFPSPLLSGLLLTPLPGLGQLLPLISMAPLQALLLARDHHLEPHCQSCEIWGGIWPPV